MGCGGSKDVVQPPAPAPVRQPTPPPIREPTPVREPTPKEPTPSPPPVKSPTPIPVVQDFYDSDEESEVERTDRVVRKFMVTPPGPAMKVKLVD